MEWRTVERAESAGVEFHELGEVVVAQSVRAKVGVFGHEGEVRDKSCGGRHGDLEIKLGCEVCGQRVAARGALDGTHDATKPGGFLGAAG